MGSYDVRAARQALRALGMEPAPVANGDGVALAGGGNEVAMSLWRALGRGTSELAEPQIKERQERQLRQFEKEAAECLRVLAAFRTLDLDERPALPAPVLVHSGAVAVIEDMAAQQYPEESVIAGDLSRSKADDPEPSAVIPYSVVAGRLAGRVAPDMETCSDCRRLVAWIPALGHYIHVDDENLFAWPLDGGVVHEDKWKAAALDLQYRGPGVQEGPAMGTEEQARAIVARVQTEVVQPHLEDMRRRDRRDSGIDPTADTDTFFALPPAVEPFSARWARRLRRARGWLDGYTDRTMDEAETYRARHLKEKVS